MNKLLLSFILVLTFVSYSRAQSVPVDPRISKYYSAEQIEDMKKNSPGKLKELTVYYTSSYIFHNGKSAPRMDLSEVDVTPFEHLRHQSKRISTGYSRVGHVIELLSKDELEALYKKIK